MTVKVHLIKSERGWGARVDEVKEFPTREEAEAYVREFNKVNNLPVTPDWHMYASIVN